MIYIKAAHYMGSLFFLNFPSIIIFRVICIKLKNQLNYFKEKDEDIEGIR